MTKPATLQEIRSSTLTSIYGRRLALDVNEFLIGPKDIKVATQSLTSGTTSTTITNYGQAIFNVTTASASTGSSVGTTEVGLSWLMDAPEPGVRKLLVVENTTSSTAGVVVEFGTGVTAYWSSLGSTFTGVLLSGKGAWCELQGRSTAVWMFIGGSTSTSFASSN